MRTLAIGMMMTAALLGCSEASSDGEGGASGDGGATSTSSGDGGQTGEGGASTTGSASSGGDGGSAPLGDVVVNEISATDDWIELYNSGSTAFDLGGLTLADAAAEGGPKLDEAIIFPAGTTLPAGGYLFVLAKQDAVVTPGEQAPQTTCAPGPSPCFYAPFGLSDADGDEIFLVDGDVTVASGVYPPAAVAEGESWGRLPNGTGDFAANAPTPGAANAAP